MVWKFELEIHFFLRFILALCENNFRECPLFPVLCDISLFLKKIWYRFVVINVV